MEYARRFTLAMTNLGTAHKRKDRSRLYHIVENDFTTTELYHQVETRPSFLHAGPGKNITVSILLD